MNRSHHLATSPLCRSYIQSRELRHLRESPHMNNEKSMADQSKSTSWLPGQVCSYSLEIPHHSPSSTKKRRRPCRYRLDRTAGKTLVNFPSEKAWNTMRVMPSSQQSKRNGFSLENSTQAVLNSRGSCARRLPRASIIRKRCQETTPVEQQDLKRGVRAVESYSGSQVQQWLWLIASLGTFCLLNNNCCGSNTRRRCQQHKSCPSAQDVSLPHGESHSHYFQRGRSMV